MFALLSLPILLVCAGSGLNQEIKTQDAMSMMKDSENLLTIMTLGNLGEKQLTCTKVNPTAPFQSILTGLEPETPMTAEGKKWQVNELYKYRDAELKCPHGVSLNKMVDFRLTEKDCAQEVNKLDRNSACNVASYSWVEAHFKKNC